MTKECNLLGKFNLEGIPPAPRGVPQIEVSFDIDANGIMNVSAQDKGTGKTNHVTITNDKGRLSKQDIERMVAEAERYKQQDEAIKRKIEAKNGLESYAYNVKNSINDEKMRDKISQEDRNIIENKVQELSRWIESNPDAPEEQYQAKQKEMENIVNPIMQKMYSGAAGGASGFPGGTAGGFPGASANASHARPPNVEEVD